MDEFQALSIDQLPTKSELLPTDRIVVGEGEEAKVITWADLKAELPKDIFLESASFDPPTQVLTLTLVGGSEVTVDLGYLKDQYTAGAGMQLTTNEFSVKAKGVGLPMLADEVTSLIASKALASDLAAHIADAVRHITAAERTAWNAKEPAISPKNTAFNVNFETNAANIKTNGTASAGTLNKVARADHIHGSDPTKANLSGSASQILLGDGSTMPAPPETVFTPSLEGTTTVGVGTYATRVGRVSRIGSHVLISVYIDITYTTMPTGNMLLLRGVPINLRNLADDVNPGGTLIPISYLVSTLRGAYVYSYQVNTLGLAVVPQSGSVRTLTSADVDGNRISFHFAQTFFAK